MSDAAPLPAPVAPPAQPAPQVDPDATAWVDNRTDLPDNVIGQYVMDHWTETAGLQFARPSTFQLWTNTQGSLLARTPFRVPSNIIEEVKLARSVADTDDDVGATIGAMLSIAYGEGMRNLHEDEKTLSLFNEIGKDMDLDMTVKEMYREYLIAAQVTTVSLFTRTRLSYFPTDIEGSSEPVNAQLATPLVGVIPAENIRVVSNDIFGTGALAYKVEDNDLQMWLQEFFNPATTPARKAAMAQAEPIPAALFTGPIQVPWNDGDLFSAGQTLWGLNPRMVHRTTMPKGALPYPRPLLTRNFALLEAKRLLNIMDYALLQGGTNYIVVAKKGTDDRPAEQPEVDNLVEQVQHASRSGVLVGDHRVNIEIITPKLDELLNPAKRKLIGRKLSMAMLRIPEQVTGDPGQAGATQELEFTARTITSDRHDMRRHIENYVYEETARRNISTFKRGAPVLWHPRVVLSGSKDFYASVLQARDRGDIPRRWSVETLGFDYDAGLAERRREVERGDDEVLAPASVPFSTQPGGAGAPGQADPFGRPTTPNGPVRSPGDIQGRPPGGGGNGRGQNPNSDGLPSSPPRRLIQRTRGETVRAIWDEVAERSVRVGELTHAILEEYPDYTVGRVTAAEREAVEHNAMIERGPVSVVPVNPTYAVTEVRAFRLDEGLAMVVGQRHDSALVARALSFREPHWDLTRGEEMARRWGFPVELTDPEELAAVERRQNHLPTRCRNCGADLPSYSPLLAGIICPNCGAVNTGDPARDGSTVEGGNTGGPADMVTALREMTKALERVGSPQFVVLNGSEPRVVTEEQANALEMEQAKTDGLYIYLRCPECGLIQDAAHDTCTRCGHDLTEARKGMFAELRQKGEKPTRHKNPPPPASEQPDTRS